MDRIERHIQQVLQVAGLPSNHEQGEELKGHITDLASAYAAEGIDESQATERALQELGKPEVLGRQLREVTPLRLPGRDWLILFAGVVLAALGQWLSNYFMWGRYTPWYDWEPLALFLAAGVALLVKRPLLGALAPAIGLYVAEVSMRFFQWGWRPGDSQMLVVVNPLRFQDPTFVLGRIRAGHPIDAAVVLGYVSACLLIGLVVARVRRLDCNIQPDFDRLAAGLAHLCPFMVLFGLTWGAIGVLLCTTLWYWAKDRQTFLARHTLQAAVVGVGALLTQVMAYQVIGLSWHQPEAISPVWFLALAVMAVRRVFGAMAIWSAISAFAGHDFRYPFARLLFGGGKWRWLRHV
jgi:hypothetical protein